jgi:hypothetical protein
MDAFNVRSSSLNMYYRVTLQTRVSYAWYYARQENMSLSEVEISSVSASHVITTRAAQDHVISVCSTSCVISMTINYL